MITGVKVFPNMDDVDEVIWKEDKDTTQPSEDEEEEEEEEEDDEEDDEDDEENEEEDEEEDGWVEVSEDEEEEQQPSKKKAKLSDGQQKNSTTKKRKLEPEEEDEDEEDDEGEWESVSENDSEEEEENDEDEEDEKSDAESGSEDGDDDDAEQEEEEEETNFSKRSAKHVESIRNRLDARRVLTDQDFALIAKLKAAQAERLLEPRFRTKAALAARAKKEQADEEDGEEGGGKVNDFSVDPSSLAAGMRTSKTTKIEKMMRVLDGRKDVRFEHEGHAGGLTNKEKLRLKNFVMVRKGKRSVANKVRKSNSDVRYDAMKHKDPYGRDKRKRRRT